MFGGTQDSGTQGHNRAAKNHPADDVREADGGGPCAPWSEGSDQPVPMLDRVLLVVAIIPFMCEGTPCARGDSDGPAIEALAAGTPRRVGAFRFYFDHERWEWSPEVADMHGYDAVPMTPTTDQVLAHKHPEDRHQVATTLDYIRQHRSAFSTRHRIIDTHGREHHVVVAGDELRDASGVVGTHGFYIDLTVDSAAEQARITEGIAEITERRAVIEQAKGMVMAVYGVDAATAFEIVRWRSQQTNTKVRDLAEQLITDFQQACTQGLPDRSPFDHLLMTVDERVKTRHHT